MKHTIRLSKASLSQAEIEAVQRPLINEYLGMGQETRFFEEELSAFLGRPAVCVANGTAALHLALQSIGIGPGDEVLVPSLTYIASFQAISATGATPIPCDIDPFTCTLSVDDLSLRLSGKTKAVMPVHYAGDIGSLERIYDFSRKHGLRVVEDAAHAFGTKHQGQFIGSMGDVVCFSFDGIKNITSGEGGCVVSDDTTVLQSVRDARLLGVVNDTASRYSGGRSWDFDVAGQGWRYHMSDIMASIGRTQLKRRENLAKARQKWATLYVERLSKNEKIRPILTNFQKVVPHIFPVHILGMRNRNDLRARLKAKGIETGVHYHPNHFLSFYSNHVRAPLPNTEAIYPELLTLPLHPDLTDSDIDFVCLTLIEELS